MASTRDVGFLLWANTWLSDAKLRRATPAERGVYIDLLCSQWLDGPLPDDADSLARQLGAKPAEIRTVLERWFQKQKSGAWLNMRLEREREDRERNRAEQKKKAQGRWRKLEGG